MLEVANSNLHIEDLEEYDEDGNVEHTGKEVMEIIIREGMDLMMDLMAKQEEADAMYEDEEEEEIIETTEYYIEEPVYEVTYYEVYYDPFYISPCWGVYYY